MSKSKPKAKPLVRPEDDVVRCHCGYDLEAGQTVCCDGCNMWQHSVCVGGGDNLPDPYHCQICTGKSGLDKSAPLPSDLVDILDAAVEANSDAVLDHSPDALEKVKKAAIEGRITSWEEFRKKLVDCFSSGGGTPRRNMSKAFLKAREWVDAKVKEVVTMKEDPPTKLDAASEAMLSMVNILQDAKDENGRDLSKPFRRLPPRYILPSYYEEIAYPVDLRKIAMRIQLGQYPSRKEFLRELNLVWSNAKKFNPQQSSIHEDAVTLAKLTKELTSNLTLNTNGTATPTQNDTGGNRTPKTPKFASPPANRNSTEAATSGGSAGRRSSVSVKKEESDGEKEVLDQLQTQMMQVLEEVTGTADSDGRKLCTDFMRLPTQKALPEYYEVIEYPVDLEKVQKRVKQRQYPSKKEFLKELNLVWSNAKKFNEPKSQIYSDATSLSKITRDVATAVFEGKSDSTVASTSGTTTPKQEVPSAKEKVDLKAQMEEVLLFVFTHAAEDSRLLAQDFMKLPSKRSLPEYYEVIEYPVDLEKVQKRVKQRQYPSKKEFLKELNLVWSNAKKFNEPKSQIYRDATALAKLCKQKAAEVFDGTSTGGGGSTVEEYCICRGPETDSMVCCDDCSEWFHLACVGVSESKARSMRQFVCENCKQVRDEKKDEQRRNQSPRKKKEVGDDMKDFHEKLKGVCDRLVRYVDETTGKELGKQFERVPSRRSNPEYYDLISQPIDFTRILKRIKQQQYANIKEFSRDISLIFLNAKKFYPRASPEYKDATTMYNVSSAMIVEDFGSVAPESPAKAPQGQQSTPRKAKRETRKKKAEAMDVDDEYRPDVQEAEEDEDEFEEDEDEEEEYDDDDEEWVADGVVAEKEEIYCLCRKPAKGQMIGCEECAEWYHLRCVGLKKSEVEDLDDYICPKCEDTIYCICQKPAKGQMVACDQCEDWFHLSCVGLQKGEVSKMDKYVCPNCEEADTPYCICRQPAKGAMIECDNCRDWFHLRCVSLRKAEADRLDRYFCVKCDQEKTDEPEDHNGKPSEGAEESEGGGQVSVDGEEDKENAGNGVVEANAETNEPPAPKPRKELHAPLRFIKTSKQIVPKNDFFAAPTTSLPERRAKRRAIVESNDDDDYDGRGETGGGLSGGDPELVGYPVPGKALYKRCPKCDAEAHVRLQNCKDCDFEFLVRKRPRGRPDTPSDLNTRSSANPAASFATSNDFRVRHEDKVVEADLTVLAAAKRSVARDLMISEWSPDMTMDVILLASQKRRVVDRVQNRARLLNAVLFDNLSNTLMETIQEKEEERRERLELLKGRMEITLGLFGDVLDKRSPDDTANAKYEKVKASVEEECGCSFLPEQTALAMPKDIAQTPDGPSKSSYTLVHLDDGAVDVVKGQGKVEVVSRGLAAPTIPVEEEVAVEDPFVKENGAFMLDVLNGEEETVSKDEDGDVEMARASSSRKGRKRGREEDDSDGDRKREKKDPTEKETRSEKK